MQGVAWVQGCGLVAGMWPGCRDVAWVQGCGLGAGGRLDSHDRIPLSSSVALTLSAHVHHDNTDDEFPTDC